MTRLGRFRRFALVLTIISLVLGFGSWLEDKVIQAIDVNAISPRLSQVGVFFGVLNLNLLLLAVAIFLVLRAAVKLAIDRKKGVFGSSLRTKLVTSFVFFAVLPTIILIYMTSKFVGGNFDKWMPSGIVEVTQRSARSERAYQDLTNRSLLDLALSDVSGKTLPQRVDFIYFDANKEILLRDDFQSERNLIVSLIRSERDKIKESRDVHWIGQTSDRPVGLAVRNLEGRVFAGVIAPAPIHHSWQLLSEELERTAPGIELLRLSYYVMLGVLSLLIVFSATWLGFTIAREFSGPLLALAQAADRVAQGDYHLEIDEFVSDDEMGFLAQSFRSMVHDLREASDKANASAAELASKAQQLERNSQYNAVLVKHVNSGVIVMSRSGLIETWNDQAEQIFGLPSSGALGHPAVDVLDSDFFDAVLKPYFAALLPDDRPKTSLTTEEASTDARSDRVHTRTSYRGVIEGREKNLQLTLAELDTGSLLVLMEDLTELERAQRVAAWRDVARRVAHEIKNPLTPITLGVQRLQRRFSSRLEGADLEVFQDSTRIVLDSAESIRRLVEEFNKFARMPQALMTTGNFIDAVQLALSGFAKAEEPGIPLFVREQIRESASEGPTQRDIPADAWAPFGKKNLARFDKDQIVRLVSNLVSNALEACEDNASKVSVEVLYRTTEAICELKIVDEGPGIPKHLRSKIFEPYFSTRRRGSGLGLPIVRQIVAEHRGEITVLDHAPSGTEFIVTLPLLNHEDRISAQGNRNPTWTDI